MSNNTAAVKAQRYKRVNVQVRLFLPGCQNYTLKHQTIKKIQAYLASVMRKIKGLKHFVA